MLSFVTTSLYTNTSIVYTLNIIKNYVNNDDQFTRKTTISQKMFIHPVNPVLTTTSYTFNSQFYKQPNDVVIGAPTSSTAAEII